VNMGKEGTEFGIKLNNIPFLNLRNEFKKNYGFISSAAFEAYLNAPQEPIKTPYGVWSAPSDHLMTFILQRSILGVESYLPIALKSTAHNLGVATNELFYKIDNAFGWKALFKEVPKLVSQEINLHRNNAQLYEKAEKFYNEVRNPLFHGREINGADVDSMRAAFSYINEIYMWIDEWYLH